MKSVAILFSFLLCNLCFSFAQKTGHEEKTNYAIDNKVALSTFLTKYIGNENPVENLKRYLSSLDKNLESAYVKLRLVHVTESPRGVHYTFAQYYLDHKIFRSQVKVNMDKRGNIKSIFDYTFSAVAPNSDFTKLEALYQSLPVAGMADTSRMEFIYFPEKEKLIPALHLEVLKGDNYFENVYNEEGGIIYHHDLANYFFAPPPDTLVNATIFLPDPITSAGVSYGTPYADAGNSDVAELNAERISGILPVTFDSAASLFKLENPYIKITDHSQPSILPATSAVADFNFTRSQTGFEDVNVFYHLSNFHSYMTGLGFDLVNYQLNADAHALSGQDNSNFIAFPNPRLNFGEGGVDDGEDADVIIHEYGHAISNSAAPGTNFGNERTALDEALGDYLASSYSRSINPYRWDYVFSWDGHNEFWGGRFTVSTDHYPEDKLNDLYEDADLWSSTMMEIWEDIGRENTDALQLQALYGYSSGMSMSDAAQLVIQADSLLNNGQFYPQICNRFYNRGLVNFCALSADDAQPGKEEVRLINSAGFAEGREAWLVFQERLHANIQLMDLCGRLLENNISSEIRFPISGKHLPSGIYLLKVNGKQFERNFKLVKY